MGVDLGQLASVVQAVGVIGLLAIAVLGGMRGVYIWKTNHEMIVAEKDERIAEMRQDRDEWKTLALRLMGTTEKSVEVAKKAVRGGDDASA